MNQIAFESRVAVNGAGKVFAVPQVSVNLVSAALKSDALFEKMKEELPKNADVAKSINGVLLYNINEKGKTLKQWTVDLKNVEVYEGAPKSGKADLTVTVSDDDMVDIAAGTVAPQVAYLKGKLKLAGNLMLAQKMEPLLKSQQAKL
ncbi:hypothetical protein O0L34_g9159 [Tuta absoluta]|nr:hypothetical protein O0L34_g9159 [Tuta absoluta]